MERRIFGLENEYGITFTLRGQRRLSPDEVARYVFRRVVSWGRSSNVFLANGARAAELGLTPLARVTATAVSGLAPEVMGMGPVDATRRALAKAGLAIGDVDVVECHENFAAQVIPVCRELGIDVDGQLNPYGGSLALGHPSGMTGVRIVVTLLNGLRALDGTVGLATTCAAGGQGLTVVVERLS